MSTVDRPSSGLKGLLKSSTFCLVCARRSLWHREFDLDQDGFYIADSLHHYTELQPNAEERATPTPQSVRVDLLTDVAIKLTLNARLLQEEPGSSLAAYYTRIRELQRSMARPGWNEVRQTRAIRAANDPFIPVLVDRDTASAGESFVQCLLQMDNVVLIGVNTKGLCLAALAVSA